jgi:F-type H+-transporting ATPase subunit epsilon
MNLKILLPEKVLLEQEVNKIIAEGENGSFVMLPNHIDFVTAIVPGILSFESTQGQEIFIAVDEGILVKCNTHVFVSIRNAISGHELETLQKTVEEQFKKLDERETIARSAIAKLEVGVIRGFINMGN